MKNHHWTEIVSALLFLAILWLLTVHGTSAQLPANLPTSAPLHTKVLWTEQAGNGNWAGVRVSYLQADESCYLVIGETALPVACPAVP
jgi:hypothetical protein